MPHPRLRIAHFLTTLLFFALVGCATRPPLVNHTFTFDVRWDNPDVQILDFRYGDSGQPQTRMPQWQKDSGQRQQSALISGPMPRASELYVKWLDKRTGHEYEDTVVLTSRLPPDITNHTITFIPRGSQLYVYLVTPERRAADTPANGPRISEGRKTITLYPSEIN